VSDPPMAEPADFDTRVRAAIYGWIVERAEAPAVEDLASALRGAAGGDPRNLPAALPEESSSSVISPASENRVL
jgi:hypothetical protein